MKRFILGGAIAMLLGPAVALANPILSHTHGSFAYNVRDGGFTEPVSCNTGGATSLLVGAAALGLVLRRRR
ncbi:MAG: hypothetical protein H6Q90_823 [Deltaproteobacteria bacterium]|nr:hypothetical protein [Deltaproteobacteria bacterium]